MTEQNLAKAIAKIVSMEGDGAFASAKRFNSLLSDISPELVKERQVLQKALNDEILNRFLSLYRGECSDVKLELMRLKKHIEDNMLMSEKWCSFIIYHFALAFNWESPIEYDPTLEPIEEKPAIIENTIDTVVKEQNSFQQVDTPDSIERLLSNAKLHFSLKRYDEAEKIYEKISRLYADRYEGWWGLILCETQEFNLFGQGLESRLTDLMQYVRASAPADIYKKLEDQYFDYVYSVAASISDENASIYSERIEYCKKKIDEEKKAISVFEHQKENIIVNFDHMEDATERSIKLAEEKVTAAEDVVKTYDQDLNKYKTVTALRYYIPAIAMILFAAALVFFIGSGFFGRLVCIVLGVILFCFGMATFFGGVERKKYDESDKGKSLASRKAGVKAEQNRVSGFQNLLASDEKEKKYWVEDCDEKIKIFKNNIFTKEKAIDLFTQYLACDAESVLQVICSEKVISYGIPKRVFEESLEMKRIKELITQIRDIEKNCLSSDAVFSDVSADNEADRQLVDYVRIVACERANGDAWVGGPSGLYNTTIIKAGTINRSSGEPIRTIKFEFNLKTLLGKNRRLNTSFIIYDEYGKLVKSFSPWWEDTKGTGYKVLYYKWNVVNENGNVLINKGHYRAVLTPDGYPGYEVDFEIR